MDSCPSEEATSKASDTKESFIDKASHKAVTNMGN